MANAKSCLVRAGEVYAWKDAAGKRVYQSFTAPTKKEAEFLAVEYIYKRKNTNREKLTFQEESDQYIENRQNILSPEWKRQKIFREKLKKSIGVYDSGNGVF